MATADPGPAATDDHASVEHVRQVDSDTNCSPGGSRPEAKSCSSLQSLMATADPGPAATDCHASVEHVRQVDSDTNCSPGGSSPEAKSCSSLQSLMATADPGPAATDDHASVEHVRQVHSDTNCSLVGSKPEAQSCSSLQSLMATADPGPAATDCHASVDHAHHVDSDTSCSPGDTSTGAQGCHGPLLTLVASTNPSLTATNCHASVEQVDRVAFDKKCRFDISSGEYQACSLLTLLATDDPSPTSTAKDRHASAEQIQQVDFDTNCSYDNTCLKAKACPPLITLTATTDPSPTVIGCHTTVQLDCEVDSDATCIPDNFNPEAQPCLSLQSLMSTAEPSPVVTDCHASDESVCQVYSDTNCGPVDSSPEDQACSLLQSLMAAADVSHPPTTFHDSVGMVVSVSQVDSCSNSVCATTCLSTVFNLSSNCQTLRQSSSSSVLMDEFNCSDISPTSTGCMKMKNVRLPECETTCTCTLPSCTSPVLKWVSCKPIPAVIPISLLHQGKSLEVARSCFTSIVLRGDLVATSSTTARFVDTVSTTAVLPVSDSPLTKDCVSLCDIVPTRNLASAPSGELNCSLPSGGSNSVSGSGEVAITSLVCSNSSSPATCSFVSHVPSSDFHCSDHDSDSDYVPESESSTGGDSNTGDIAVPASRPPTRANMDLQGCVQMTKVKPGGKRVWNKVDYCLYCGIKQAKVARHCLLRHEDKVMVKEIQALELKSLERREKITELRNKGNFHHNLLVWQSGTGEIVPRKRPIEDEAASNYLPCEFCQGCFKREGLWKHQIKCAQKNKVTKKKRIQSMAKMMIPSLTGTVSESLKKNVISRMRADDVTSVVRRDPHILNFGTKMIRDHPEAHQALPISQNMRDLAKLVVATSRVDRSVTSIRDCLNPQKFDTLVDAVKVTAGYCADTNTYKTPSFARNIGYSIDKVAASGKSSSIKSENTELFEAISNFQQLKNAECTSEVVTLARHNLDSRKLNKPHQTSRS
ncbi:uncharacterized protein LOC110978527 [Acanthaster planci]|uniref:Uncharacterized protein LOC110978527 n=1 Tax=Acanthaster planci TaxID=133434 RepID=A0A8B7Y9P9_ACAPL|nr:uncharacterized protein LOC110978527 [Acanthaster planci]